MRNKDKAFEHTLKWHLVSYVACSVVSVCLQIFLCVGHMKHLGSCDLTVLYKYVYYYYYYYYMGGHYNAKTSEPIVSRFGGQTLVGPRTHILDGDAHAHWRHLTNTMCGGDVVFTSNTRHCTASCLSSALINC